MKNSNIQANGMVKYLEIDELKRIELYFDTLEQNHAHYLTVKSFLFCCYTGCRYGDGKNFKLADIVNNCIVLEQEKTKTTVLIPVMPKTKALIDYDLDINLPNLKTPCVETCDITLKEVSIICKIKKPITTHSARYTFGCIAINNGLSKETIQAVLGHSISQHNATA